MLEIAKPIPKGEMMAIPGLTHDFILHTFEPDIILDYIDQGKFEKIYILGNKAIVSFKLPQKNNGIIRFNQSK